jgi:hypothetical protein
MTRRTTAIRPNPSWTTRANGCGQAVCSMCRPIHGMLNVKYTTSPTPAAIRARDRPVATTVPMTSGSHTRWWIHATGESRTASRPVSATPATSSIRCAAIARR